MSARRVAAAPSHSGAPEKVLAALLKTRAEARQAGLSSLEQELREHIRRTLPMLSPVDKTDVPEPSPAVAHEDPACPEAWSPDAFEPLDSALDGSLGRVEDDVELWKSAPALAHDAPIRVARFARLPIAGERRSERRVVNLAADLREPGAVLAEVEIANISEHGFMMKTDAEVEIDGCAWLKLPGFEPFKCQVVWAEDGEVGCRFLTPLYPATLELILKPAPKPKQRRLFTPPVHEAPR